MSSFVISARSILLTAAFIGVAFGLSLVEGTWI